jgi:outer membrane protein assembly factor BamB
MAQFLARVRSRLLAKCAAALGLLAAMLPAARAQDSILVADYAGSKVVKCAYPSGTAQSHFVGTGMTALNGAVGMTFGPDGNLYFCSYNTNSIIRVNGQTGVPFGSTSTFVAAGAGGLSHPTGLTFGPDGKLYVSSQTTNAVLRYDTDGTFLNAFVSAGSGTLAGPWGLAFRAGNLYVVSNTNAKVLRYNGATGAFLGEEVTAAQAGLSLPRGLLFDSGGRMYVTGANSVYAKDGANFALLVNNATIPGLVGTDQLSLAADGNLMVPCHNGTVQKVDRLTGASLGVLVLNGAGGLTTNLQTVLVLPNACGSADFDGDGDTATDADIEAFFRVLAGGHC